MSEKTPKSPASKGSGAGAKGSRLPLDPLVEVAFRINEARKLIEPIPGARGVTLPGRIAEANRQLWEAEKILEKIKEG